jgi:DNA-binding NarL/FixJ family response regulator
MLSDTRRTLRFPERSRRLPGRHLVAADAPSAEEIAPAADRITVAVVHQNAISGEGLSRLLSAQPDIRVVASSGGDLAALRDAQADVLLLSIGSQDAESVRAAVSLLTSIANTRVVVVAPRGVLSGLASLVQAGAYAIVLDDASPDELLRTVRSVAEGVRVWPPATVEALLAQFVGGDAHHPVSAHADGTRTTRREREVLARIAEGLSTKEIARDLGIARFTVCSHVRNIMEKLHVHSRLQIAAHVHREQQGGSPSVAGYSRTPAWDAWPTLPGEVPTAVR